MYWFRWWLEDLTDEQATDLRIIVPCWVHVHNFLSNQELYGTIWNYIELYGTMWNYMELYGTINIIWDHSSQFPTTRSHFSIIVIVMLGAQTWTPGDALVVDSSLDHLTSRQNAQPVGLVEGYPLVNQRNYGKKKHHFSWGNPLFLWPFTMLLMGKSTISTGPFSSSQSVNVFSRGINFGLMIPGPSPLPPPCWSLKFFEVHDTQLVFT